MQAFRQTKPRLREAPARRRDSGFTLLELVAVIGIIAIMSVVVVGGFNSILRAISGDTADSGLKRILNAARQQACVDGQDVYVWVTGMNSYAVVRKAGTVTGRNTGSRDFEWGTDKSLSNLGDGRALWLFDAYADLGNVGLSFSFDDDFEENDVRAVFDQYKGLLVFDMEDGTMANVIVPPTFANASDAWVFGVEKSEAGSSFKVGSDYGWVVLPEQYLPKGYVFDGSFDADGSFKKGYDRKVRFDPTGVPDAETDFPVKEVSTGGLITVTVKKTGEVTTTKSE